MIKTLKDEELYIVLVTDKGLYYAYERQSTFFLRRFKNYKCIAGPFSSWKKAWESIIRYDCDE